MIRHRILLKSLAVFFIIEMMVSTVAPAISWALTAGPTAPEFSSFEPVDTTDMVNLATGDFVYNTPIIEVPGPEGGYPLSLSYHAGIKTDQEASWVGLGFTLNPGAINRTVDGFADDNFETKKQVRDYWGGGESTTRTYTAGASFRGISLSYSLAETRDTYKGFSTHSTVGLSFNPVKAVLSALSKGSGGMQKGAEVAGNLSEGIGGENSLGIVMDSKGVKTNLSLFGESLSEKNNLAGNISSFTREDLTPNSNPLSNYYQVKDFYTRYWSDEAQALTTYGTLYPGEANTKVLADSYANYSVYSEFTTYAFDSYDIFNTQVLNDRLRNTSVVDDENNPTKQLGGSLPAYDHYNVLGQGIGGVMQPFIFENGDLLGQNLYERGQWGEPVLTNANLEYKSLKKFSDKKVDFRFLNDFSNALTITPSDFKTTEDDKPFVDPHVVQADSYGFNNVGNNQKLAGSKHIEWFSNEEIFNGTAKGNGFVDFYADRTERKLSFDVYENYLQPEEGLPSDGKVSYGKGARSYVTDTYEDAPDPYNNLVDARFYSLKPKTVNLSKKIGGFKVTNSSGVTYHYALPVYNYNEYTRSKVKKPVKGTLTFTEHYNDDPYAYTWLLTAITGPDYVDKNTNGILDDKDWGYWVKFDYGRWSDAYQWRTPLTGYTSDVDESNVSFSYGIKELYYLDAIETRTHKAIFIKSKRKDGKGVTSRLEGGCNPRRYSMHFKGGTAEGNLTYVVSPVSTMKLDAIYLFQKDELLTIPMDKTTGDKYEEAPSSRPYSFGYEGTPYSGTLDKTNPPTPITIKQGEDFVYVKYHNGDLVYDDDDIHDLPQFKEKALRIIEFNTDYSLAQRVPNSIGYYSDFANSVTCDQSCDPLGSRIGLDFEWPRIYSIPRDCTDPFHGPEPICCTDNKNFYSKNGIFEVYNGGSGACPEFLSPPPGVSSPFPGNALEYYHTGKLTLNSVKFLGKGGVDLIPPTTFAYNPEKNPDYSVKYDEWGYYKKDFDLNVTGNTRKITPASSSLVDAWSLTSIASPLGATINIDYEANQYQKSVYNDFSVFSVEKLEAGPGEDEVRIFFKEKNLNLSQWFTVGQPIDMKAFMVYILIEPFKAPQPETETYASNDGESVVSIDNDAITIQSAALKELFTRNSFTITNYGRAGEVIGHTDYPCFPYFVSGFIKATDPPLKFSGGARTHAISIMNGLKKSETIYEYNSPSTGVSSGVTSFKPFNQIAIQYPVDDNFFIALFMSDDLKAERKKLLLSQDGFQSEINEPYKKALAFVREVPAPGSMYEYVKVRNLINDVEFDSYTLHHFKPFDESMVVQEMTTNLDTKLDTRKLTMRNKTIDVGNALSIESYNHQNELIGATTYGYLYDDTDEAFEQSSLDSKQGVVEQSFHKYITLSEYKVDIDHTNWFEKNFLRESDERTANTIYLKNRAIITTRQDRSNVVTSVKQVDVKKGLVTVSQNHAFDFYTGQVIKSVSTDSYGNNIMSVTEPAYKNYGAMGLKIYNPLQAHMLTQADAIYTYKVDGSYNPTGLLSASIKTWSDQVPVLNLRTPQTNIWRPLATYEWNGQQDLNDDGTYPYENGTDPSQNFKDHPFTNWNNSQENAFWLKTSELTLYDGFSHGLEGKDINNNYGATRMNSDQSKVIASATNSRYDEIIFSGVEIYEGNSQLLGSASQGQGNPSTLHAHTGKYSLLVGANQTGFSYTLTSGKVDLTKKYKASVWVYVPGEAETQPQLDQLQFYYTVGGNEKSAVHPISQKNKSKSWYQLNLDIIPNGIDAVFIGVRNNTQRGVYFDDFRVQPLTSSLTSYVYDQSTGEVNFILDGNNFYTRFEYDAMGRLVRTSKELLNFDFGDGKESYRADAILKEMKFNYGKGH